MGKAAYGWMIMKDENIPGTVVRTSTIPEELGRLVYLLTDKTGTAAASRCLCVHSPVSRAGHPGTRACVCAHARVERRSDVIPMRVLLTAGTGTQRTAAVGSPR